MPQISSHVHTISSPHLTVLESSAPAYPFPSLPTMVDPPPSSYCYSLAPLLSPLYLNSAFLFLCPLIEELVMRSVDSFCRVKLSRDVMLIISCLLFVERSGWSSASTRQRRRVAHAACFSFAPGGPDLLIRCRSCSPGGLLLCVLTGTGVVMLFGPFGVLAGRG